MSIVTCIGVELLKKLSIASISALATVTVDAAGRPAANKRLLVYYVIFIFQWLLGILAVLHFSFSQSWF